MAYPLRVRALRCVNYRQSGQTVSVAAYVGKRGTAHYCPIRALSTNSSVLCVTTFVLDPCYTCLYPIFNNSWINA